MYTLENRVINWLGGMRSQKIFADPSYSQKDKDGK